MELPTWILEKMQEEEAAEDIAERLAMQYLPLLQRHDHKCRRRLCSSSTGRSRRCL